jgi:hypothetical protein
LVVRVNVINEEAALGLVERLDRELDLQAVLFDETRLQVCLQVQKNPDHTLVEILNLLQSWLRDGGRAPTKVDIDDHEYVLGAR